LLFKYRSFRHLIPPTKREGGTLAGRPGIFEPKEALIYYDRGCIEKIFAHPAEMRRNDMEKWEREGRLALSIRERAGSINLPL
jgi:hypothetical protein